MSSLLYVIFREADHSVFDIYFSSEECSAAINQMVKQNPANRYKYYCKAVDMGFMSASNYMKHASNYAKHASNCTKNARK